MADELLLCGGLPKHGGEVVDRAVAPDEPIAVVERLEVIEVEPQDREHLAGRDPPLHLGFDLNVSGQTGQRRDRAHLARPAKRRLHARNELHRIERFRDVVVRARSQAEHLVRRHRLRGEHDDAHAARSAFGAQTLAHLIAVELRHHDVQDDE